MNFKSLQFRQRGAIGILLLNRPAKRNALSDTMVAELETCFTSLPKAVRVVVMHGAGEHFCAGPDLSELSDRSAAQGVVHSRMWHRIFDVIQFGSVPVVAGIAQSEPEAKKRMKDFLEKRAARVKKQA